MAVDRCVCVNVLFQELLELHREHGLGFDELVDRTGCCTGCTSCEPYVKVMLRTGKTYLPILNAEEADRVLHEWQDREGKPA
ncbi:MAG: hypothetical protein IBJ11_01900 [Phycisphaerales bacterium]|nr:hypothetical protein [Phycisphaerales bacterium]